MNAAVAIGRVGGLAATFGVGLALTTGCAVAWADEVDTTSSASSESSAEESAASPPSTKRSRMPLRTSKSGPATGTPARQEAPKNRKRTKGVTVGRIGPGPAAVRPDGLSDPVPTFGVPRISATIPVSAPPVQVNAVSGAPLAALTAPAAMTAEAPTAAPTAAPTTSIGGTFRGLLAAFGVGHLAGTSPLAPVQAPVMWGLLAWVRREFQRTESVAPAATSTVAAATLATPTTSPVAWLTGSGSLGPYLLPRTNNTALKFGIAGTDIGTMWDNGIADNPATPVDEHQILMAFGDTFSGTGMTGTWRSNVLLRSSDDNPADGITVPAGVMGDIFSGSPLSAPNFSRQIIRSPGYLGFLGREVTIIPTAGVSVPYDNAYGSRQYVSYMSVKSWDTPGRWTTNYAAIAYSDDNGQTWTVARSSIRSAGYFRTTTGYVSGNQNFQQSAFVKPPAGSADDNYVYAFGTPSGRGGTVYLSRVDQMSVLDQAAYEYWNGSAWVLNRPSAATPILPGKTTTFWFFTRKTYPSVGEMSVQYNTYLNQYVMMYADSANNVVMRTADRPEGPWSEPTTVATSVQYPGLYAPMMHPWTTDQDIYWNMSMWGDYNVLLMHTRLV